jgi:hypothetical protein
MTRITFVTCVVVVICSCVCDDCKRIASELGKGNSSHVHGRNAADPIPPTVAALGSPRVDNRYFDAQLLLDLSWNYTGRYVRVSECQNDRVTE